MAGTVKRTVGPVALTTTYTTNIYQGGGGSALIYDVIRRIHISNKLTSAVTFRIYLGATGANAAGTELFFDTSIPANSYISFPCALKMTSTDFLVGGAGTTLGLVITIESEQFVV